MTLTRRHWRGMNYQLRHEAMLRYRWALRKGILSRQPCVVCGAEKVEGHHEDYAKPLDVVWLCPTHHHRRHIGASVELMIERQAAPA